MNEKFNLTFNFDYDGESLHIAELSSSGAIYKLTDKRRIIEEILSNVMDFVDTNNEFDFKLVKKRKIIR
ncbi:hypothetical protein KB151_003893 [[Clostridium] innocuum]|nr:hypothetical protein [[Clostridium] innocuum]